MFKHGCLALLLLLLSSQFAIAKDNQQLADILEDNPAVEIRQLTENMQAVLPELPTSFMQTSWHAGVESEKWDKVRIEFLVSQVRNADDTLSKVKAYEQQYAYVFKHRNDDMDKAKQWLMHVGGAIFQMKKQAKLFEQRMRYLKKILPQVLETTAQDLAKAHDKEKVILKLRIKVQLMCYQALGFSINSDITHSEVLAEPNV